MTFQPTHVAARDFPQTPEALARYDVVMLSDIGANTLLLHPDTFVRSKPLPNRLHVDPRLREDRRRPRHDRRLPHLPGH